MTGSSRRTIVAWTLYDFANSAFSAIVYATVFPAYYANTVVGNADGRGDFWWGLVDGNHRFAAAIVRGDATILANCSGLVEELQGLRAAPSGMFK